MIHNIAEQHLYVKFALDGTKFEHKSGACVYTVGVIADNLSDIGVIGACYGADAYEDLILTAKPFFEGMLKFAEYPFVDTSAGLLHVDVKLGGDLVSVLEIFGLAKASSGHPCPFCCLP